jgi:PKD repeat protein
MKIRHLFLILILIFVMFIGCASATQLQTDHYTKTLIHFDNGNGNKTFRDDTGRAWYGRLNIIQSTFTTPDNSVSSLFCNRAAGNYIETNDVSELYPGTQEFSIEFYAKRASISGAHMIFGNMLADGLSKTSTMQLSFIADNRMKIVFGDGTTSKTINSLSAVTDTNWHKYIIMRQGRYVSLFKDGVYWGGGDHGANYVLYNSSNNYSIGRCGSFTGSTFDGYIDEFRYSVGVLRQNTAWADWYAYGDSNTAATHSSLSPNDGSLCYIYQMITHDSSLSATNCIDGYGQLSSWGASNIASYYPNPKNYIIMFGTNDMQTGRPAGTAASNVATMYNYAISHGSKCVVLVPPLIVQDANQYHNLTYQKKWLSDFESNLTSLSVQYAKAYDSLDTNPGNGVPDNANNSLYLADGVHMNSAGQTAIGNYIWNYITANFYSSSLSGTSPLTCAFTDTSNTDATTWDWDFENDGKIDSTQKNPVHQYTQAGTYSVNLTVHNEYGNFSTVKTDYITVSAPSPIDTVGKLYWWLRGYFGWLLPLQEAC